MPGPAVRLVFVVIAALTYAAAAIVSGLDRISADDAAPARGPRMFAVEAARSRALHALERGDVAAARAAARDAVARDPVEPRSLGLLGQALLAGGDAPGALAAFTVARPLGWREPFTQLYWMNARLDAGDEADAADHVDAILRQAPALAQRNLLLARFDASPAGRAQIAARLALAPAWAATYFNDTRNPAAGDPLARSEVAMLLAERFAVRDCALVAPLIEALAYHARVARARELYALHCAAAGEAAEPADGGFERADARAQATIFDWRFPGEGTIGVVLSAARGMRGRAAVVSSTARGTAPFASQMLALAPGSYRVSWRALGSDGAIAPAVDAALGCDAAADTWLAKRVTDPRAGRFAARFEVPPACVRPTLTLGIASGAEGVAVDDVSIEPVP